MSTAHLPTLTIAPAQVFRGEGILADQGKAIARLGRRPLVVGGRQALTQIEPLLRGLHSLGLTVEAAVYGEDCSESALARLGSLAQDHRADLIVGMGGGKALDTAKLLAHHQGCPVVTIPTSGATCAAWTALSNVYSDQGAFRYDVALPRCPDLLILDYDLVKTAPRSTLVAGIGDGLAKWYEASVDRKSVV